MVTDLGASFSSFGCFVFEIWVLRASVFVFECFVFETTGLAGGGEKRAELRRSARKQQFIIKVSSWRFYNWQEEVLNQKSPKVIDRLVFNYLAVDNAGQTADNKHTGSMIFPFFLLASRTDKPLGDDTFQNQSVKRIC